MIIFCQSFTAEYMDDDPQLAREKAMMFANKVNSAGDVLSISEIASGWGNSVTVWYKSMKKVEV